MDFRHTVFQSRQLSVGIVPRDRDVHLGVIGVLMIAHSMRPNQSSQRSLSGAIYIENNCGPRAEPCGTPVSTDTLSDEHDLHLTKDRRQLRYDLSQSSVVPVRPYVCRSRSISVLWSIFFCRRPRFAPRNIQLGMQMQYTFPLICREVSLTVCSFFLVCMS